MPARNRVSVARVRKAVREALAFQEGELLGEKPLLDAVNELVGGGVDFSALRDALEWNHAEAFVRREYVAEAEMDGWVITRAGLNHDRIK